MRLQYALGFALNSEQVEKYMTVSFIAFAVAFALNLEHFEIYMTVFI